MGWWPFRRRAEKRAVTFQDYWGAGADVDAVRSGTMESAITLAPVYAATRLISEGIASLPLQAYREVDDLRQPIRTPKLLAEPTMFGGAHEWVQRCLVSLLLRGNAYGLVTSVDSSGWPQQVEWLHPSDVTLLDNRAVARPQWYWLGRPVDPWLGRDSTGELLHVPWYVIPGEILGVSPVRAFATTIDQGLAVNQFGRDFFRKGAIPSAVLETDQEVDQEQAKTIKQRFVAAARGREPVVMGKGAKYKPITVPPEDSQFLETIKANATTIAAIYGIRPERIGGESGNSMTYANVEHQAIADMSDFRPYMTKLERHFSSMLPRPQYARFNPDAVLRADSKTRYETHKIGIDAGFLTVDEARQLEDRPPLPGDPPQPKPAEGEPGEGDNVIPLPRAGENGA